MNDVIRWLESPEGEAWSRIVHLYGADRLVANLVTVKEDQFISGDKLCYSESYLWVA